NPLDPAKALDYEQEYLSFAREALQEGDLKTVEDAVRLVWGRLDGVEGERRAFDRALRTGGNWAEIGGRFVLAREKHWTRARRDDALRRLLDLEDDPCDDQAAQGFMDLTWRAESFHWSARYWEGRFLLAQRERLLNRHPRNVEEALRRLCMLTPCLVSTLHTVPQWAQIDAATTGGEDPRSHVFGLFDLLVVDEAGQAVPELAGAAFALAKTAAVVGDLKQLAPIWNNSSLAEVAIASRTDAMPVLESIVRTRRSAGSGSTLGMARLVSRWTEPDDDGVTLRFHYRCKPSIIAYCNRLSYGGKLVPRTEEDDPFPEPALAWVEVDAKPQSAGGSYLNNDEAREIVDWIAERWPIWREHETTRGRHIQDLVAIITPYRPQADRLLQQLIQVFKEARLQKPGEWPTEQDVEKVTVGTVHRLQGAERPVVCFSLVEGPEQAGGSFVDRDPTLLNVAVSRAKRSFIVFANPARLFPQAVAEGGATLPPTRLLGTHLREREEAKLLYPEKLVLIEAGGKVAVLSRMLGKNARVVATGGVLLELGLENGVDIGAGFVPNPRWRAGAEEVLAKTKSQARPVAQVVFATDNDRMGEYIAWQAHRALSSALAGKRLSRVRLGSISRAAVGSAFAEPTGFSGPRILAEAVREVVDCLVSRRLGQAARLDPGRSLVAAEVVRLVRAGACTEVADGHAQPVGRVQGAVLRLLLSRAREVVAAEGQCRLRAVVRIGERIFTGAVYHATEGREGTDAKTAQAVALKLSGGRLRLALPPTVLRETTQAPWAGTAVVLATAWARHRILPWDAMASLQALYDGSWSARPERSIDPEEPIEPMTAASGGHPPITPLDRAATPDQMAGAMAEADHAVYSVVWDHFAGAEAGPIETLYVRLDFNLEGRSAGPLRVRFDGVGCPGIDAGLERIVLGHSATD
ncbi:MAG: AAA domain-containing protein, partial [Janthinobacterium lividum]